MTSHLIPCPTCARHVRARESACPFCRFSLPDAVRASVPARPIVARLSRAGLIAAGATAAAIAGAACSASSSQPGYGGVALEYDAAPYDGTTSDGATSDGATPDGAMFFDASYGGPGFFEDSGPDATVEEPDASDGALPLDADDDASD